MVELFSTKRTKNELRQYVDTMTSLGEFGAHVEYFTGSRFAYFKTLGYNYPVQITMYRPDMSFDAMRIKGEKVEIKSLTEDAGNRYKIVILGDIINGNY